ncbi:MAG: glycosyltransferase family 4 protein, partial [Candidatus Saccharibacteria bacterium]|nr:glycosyltransferase family 4 protein [Candidatus Saccharibacteria bacterium]
MMRMNMKVTIATGLYPPEIGGPATYAAMLETELPGHGFELTTVPFGWVRQYPKVLRHLVYAWKLWRESKGADMIYALDPTSVGLAAYLVARVRHKPFLVRLGGDYAWEQGRMRFGVTDTLDVFLTKRASWPFMVRQLAKVQTFVVSQAVRVVVPSEYLKRVVVQWGIDSKKIKVIYSALYPLEVHGTRQELREELECPYPTIVSAGRLVPWKGFSVLIDVVHRLKDRYPQIALVIVGDGAERAALEEKVAQLKLAQHVWFTGSITKDALGATIKAADVFVLNTAYEGLSHQLIEVMDIGTPIVTTDAGGNPELITDGVNGFLVEFNDVDALTEAIARVLGHPESRERLVQSARGRSKQFAKEEVVKEIVSLLTSIYEGRI